MAGSSSRLRLASALRWTARAWAVAVLAFAALIAITPDPHAAGLVPLSQMVELAFMGLALLGLAAAAFLPWITGRPLLEPAGGAVAVAGALGNALAFALSRGHWDPVLLAPEGAIALPGILFIVAWRLQRTARLRATP